VGRHVVSDGKLYVHNAVDALYWVLAEQRAPDDDGDNAGMVKIPWQPFEQLVVDVDIRRAIHPADQIRHLCETLSDERLPETQYRFSASKALRWLERKRELVVDCLRAELREDRRRNQRKAAETQDTFFLPGEAGGSSSAVNDETGLTETDESRLDRESLQTIRAYRTPEWARHLAKHLGLDDDEPAAASKAKTTAPASASTSKMSVYSHGSSFDGGADEPEKAAPAPRTMGNKSLDKVNKRGMKSLTSFFGAKKSKTKTVE